MPPSKIPDRVSLPLATWEMLRRIAYERGRQISNRPEGESRSLEHDDEEHIAGELAVAAACYAMSHRTCEGTLPSQWPWAAVWWKPKDRESDLVRAAALIVAELERLERAKARG